MSYLNKQRSFTLLELIIVIGIILILVAISTPGVYKAKEHALGKEAISNLKLIAAAEKIYKMESGNYYPNIATETDVNNINNNLKLFLNENNWDYSITTTAIDNFTATAARNGSSGYLDCQYTIAHDDADGEPNSNGSCP